METTIQHEPMQRSTLSAAQTVARDFLAAALPAVVRIDITKVAPTAGGGASWEAEADVWQPNPVISSLGIETGRPVLDCHRYLVRLDPSLNVTEYELA